MRPDCQCNDDHLQARDQVRWVHVNVIERARSSKQSLNSTPATRSPLTEYLQEAVGERPNKGRRSTNGVLLSAQLLFNLRNDTANLSCGRVLRCELQEFLQVNEAFFRLS